MGTQCQTSAACLGGFDSINSSLMKKQSFWTPLYGLGARGSYYNKASISFSFIHFIQTLSISLLNICLYSVYFHVWPVCTTTAY